VSRRAIIFDIGNVVLRFDPLTPCRELAPRLDMAPDEILDRIYASGLEWDFECGLISGEEFAARCAELLDAEFSVDEFKALWTDMFYEDTKVSSFVRQLMPHYQVMALSNTNVWHWEHELEIFPILSEFEHRGTSYTLKVMKPDVRIFEHALELCERKDDAIFIDDVERNCEGARKAGLDAIHFKDIEQLQQDLRALGIEW
jgi:HAD superfamily hydrolase (TIGR01509 family)